MRTQRANPTPDIAIVGHASIDDIVRPDGTTAPMTIGGAAMYATVGATMWPVHVGVVTRLGHDYPLETAKRASCAPDDTDWSGLVVLDGNSIRDSIHHYADGTRRVVFADAGRIKPMTPLPRDVPLSFHGSSYVHLTPAHLEWQLDLAQHAKAKKSKVSLDTEVHYLDGNSDLLMQVLASVDCFGPSIEHLRYLFGGSSSDPRAYWPVIRTMGPEAVVVKCGEAGAVVFDVPRTRSLRVPAFATSGLVDAVGAGDAFCGGYLAGLVLCGDLGRAGAYGAVAATFVVESEGAQQPAHATKEEIAARLQRSLAHTSRSHWISHE